MFHSFQIIKKNFNESTCAYTNVTNEVIVVVCYRIIVDDAERRRTTVTYLQSTCYFNLSSLKYLAIGKSFRETRHSWARFSFGVAVARLTREKIFNEHRIGTEDYVVAAN